MTDGSDGRFDATLGLGSNIGDKAANIAEAIRRLEAEGDIRIVARSRLYRTAPWGKTDQDWFVNACVSVATSLSPEALLARCLAIEADMGRVRKERWGPRVVDVDVLTYRDRVIETPSLILPHPRIAERAFVLVPLADIAPDLKLGGSTVRQLLAAIDHSDVVPAAQ